MLEKERFQDMTTRSMRDLRINLYLKYTQASEFTSDIPDELVEEVMVLSNGVQVVLKA